MRPRFRCLPTRPTRGGLRLLAVLAMLAGIAGGCASTPTTAADHARDRLETLADQHRDAKTFQVRLNPAPCDCPPFEVLLGDGWHRAFLEPPDDDGPVGMLRTQLLEADSRGVAAHARVLGTLSGGVRLAPNRMHCLVLKVAVLCENDRCPDDEE